MPRIHSSFRRDLLPPASAFYRKEFAKLTRPSRGWATARCVFHHPDNHPSLRVNFETGAFRCFPCGAKGGDIIDFIMLRDGLDFKTAAQLLGSWERQSISDAERQQLRARQRERDRIREVAEQLEAEERRLWNEYRNELHSLERDRGTINQRLTEVRRGEPERCQGEVEALWGLLADLEQQIRRTATAYTLLGFGSMSERAEFILRAGNRESLITQLLQSGYVRDEDGGTWRFYCERSLSSRRDFRGESHAQG